MTIQNTDLLLVSRGGSNYKLNAEDIMSIQDTDLMLISRAGTNYKATGLEVKDYVEGGQPGTNWQVVSTTGLPTAGSRDRLTYGNGMWILWKSQIRGSATTTPYFYSTDNGASWFITPDPIGQNLTSISYGGGFWYGWVRGSNPVCYRSVNGINNWTAAGSVTFQTVGTLGVNIGPSAYVNGRLFVISDTIFAGNTGTTTIYWSTDNGATWPLGQTSTFSSLWAVSKFDVTTDYDAYAFGIYDSNNAGVMAKAVPTSTSVQTIIWQTTNGVDNTVLAFGTAGLATKCLISQFTQVLTSNTAAGPYTTTTTTLGFNQANYAFYYAPSNTIALFASGGSATFSYDGGATWVASSAQYGIPGLSTSSWSGAAAGGGFALALTTNNLLIRSTI